MTKLRMSPREVNEWDMEDFQSVQAVMRMRDDHQTAWEDFQRKEVKDK